MCERVAYLEAWMPKKEETQNTGTDLGTEDVGSDFLRVERLDIVVVDSHEEIPHFDLSACVSRPSRRNRRDCEPGVSRPCAFENEAYPRLFIRGRRVILHHGAILVWRCVGWPPALRRLTVRVRNRRKSTPGSRQHEMQADRSKVNGKQRGGLEPTDLDQRHQQSACPGESSTPSAQRESLTT
jgi:hypothetical protein